MERGAEEWSGAGPPRHESGSGGVAEPPVDWEVRPFQPAPWLPGAHLQTVGGKYLRPRDELETVRERVETEDGDFVDLDWAPEPDPDAPLVLVLHGLGGSARRPYVQLALRELAARGIRGVGMNFRCCSGEMNRTARFYHSGETEDMAFLLERIAERLPGRRMGALGFSLGGNALLKYLGERGPGTGVDAAVAISVPFDLDAGSAHLEKGVMGRIYTYYFVRDLRRKTLAKADLLRDLVDLEAVRTATTLRVFDEVATAPLHGFEGALDYYTRSSSARFLADVRTPTLLLQSRDDPFLPPGALPLEAIRDNPWLVDGITHEGGHVGFVEGPGPWAPSFWAEREAARFLAERLRD